MSCRGTTDWALCLCRGPRGEEYFAQLRLLFAFQRRNSDEDELCAFVRWYDCTTDGLALGVLPNTRPQQVGHRLSTLTATRQGEEEPDYDVIAADSILRPVVLQPHPSDPHQVVYNHFFESFAGA